MKTPLRLSPVHDLLQFLNGSWRDLNGMPTLTTVPTDNSIATHLGIADLSFLTRFGVKGANAAAWLTEQGIPVPDRPNSWLPLPSPPTSLPNREENPVPLLPREKGLGDEGIIARLGLTEFLIEDSLHSTVAAQLAKVCQNPPARVYPVLRQDLAIALCGVAINELLQQTCNINFRALSLTENPVVLTSIIGVSVTVIPSERNGQPFYRIWCDGTFGAYMWKTLVTIAEELGGGAIGAEMVTKMRKDEPNPGTRHPTPNTQ